MKPVAYGRLLAHEGLAESATLPPFVPPGPPWYAQLLAGFSAWCAALFLLGSLWLGAWRLLDSPGSRAIVGALACLGCAILAARRHAAGPSAAAGGTASGHTFGAQIVTAISLAGYALLVSSVIGRGFGAVHVAGLSAGAGLVLWWLNPEPIHRLLMACATVWALALLCILYRLIPIGVLIAAVATTALWLTQARWTAAGLRELVSPLGHATATLLVLLPAVMGAGTTGGALQQVGLGARRGDPGPFGWLAGALDAVPWATAVGLGLLLALVTWHLVRAIPRRPMRAGAGAAPGTAAGLSSGWLLIVMGGIFAAVLVGWRAPGVFACLLLWPLGLWTARPVLAGGALAGLGLYLFQLYYALQMTLMQKGLVLVATGAVLLVLGFLLDRHARSRQSAPFPDTVST